jgi:hypothetical protein
VHSLCYKFSSKGFHKCRMSCIYYYNTDQFHCPESPMYFTYSATNLFTISIMLPFPHWHTIRILPYTAFSVWLFSLQCSCKFMSPVASAPGNHYSPVSHILGCGLPCDISYLISLRKVNFLLVLIFLVVRLGMMIYKLFAHWSWNPKCEYFSYAIIWIHLFFLLTKFPIYYFIFLLLHLHDCTLYDWILCISLNFAIWF